MNNIEFFKIQEEITEVARIVYDQLGSGHRENVYQEAMNIELQERGWMVKTEMPVAIDYTTTKGLNITIGHGRTDLYCLRNGIEIVIELKSTYPITSRNSSSREYFQVLKYLKSLKKDYGFLINFAFPPLPMPELVVVKNTD
jgi:GxxExxY protein